MLVTIETSRLILRPFESADAEVAFRVVQRPARDAVHSYGS